MNKRSRLIETLLIIISALMVITFLIVASITFVSRSDGLQTPDGEEETEGDGEEGEVEDEPVEKTLSYYLELEDVPFFSPSYLDVIEETYRRVYYKPEDIPESEALAASIASLYREYCADKVDPYDYMEVTYALIDCLIEAVGDKYSFYRTREEALEYDTDMSGSFAGIGVEILRNNLENTILVERVHVDSPAEAAGILPGDYIVGAEGFRIEDIGTEALVSKIRGEVGTTVTVTVKRGDDEIECEMVRAPLTEITVRVTYLEEGKIANVRITGFKDNTAAQFAAAIDEVEASGALAVIFDLRDNGGGYLRAVTAMLSYLVPDGTLIASYSNGKAATYAWSGEGNSTEPEDHVLTLPSVVVVNGRSASASELFTSALRDYNDMGILDSTVVGSITFKKGVMQSTYEFSDGSTLTLTISLYNPPSGINFDGVGIDPDVPVLDGEDPIETAVSVLMEKIILE